MVPPLGQGNRGHVKSKKIVDDILVWATDLPTLYDRVRANATRCAELNIALARKKFAIGMELSFAGLILSAEGIKPDPERIVSLSRFPVPKDVTDYFWVLQTNCSVLCWISHI